MINMHLYSSYDNVYNHNFDIFCSYVFILHKVKKLNFRQIRYKIYINLNIYYINLNFLKIIAT